MRIFAGVGQTLSLVTIGSLASVTVSARVYILDPTTQVLQELTIAPQTVSSDRTLTEPAVSARTSVDGEVVMAQVRLETGAPKRGQLFAILSIAEDGQELCRGYVTASGNLNLGTFEDSLSGRGVIRSITLTDPSNGTDYADETVPTNAEWKVRGFQGTLIDTTSLTERLLTILHNDGTNNVALIGHATHTNSSNLTRTFGGGVGFGGGAIRDAADGGAEAIEYIPVALAELRLPEAHIVRFVTEQLQGADDWGTGRLVVEEWLAV